MLNTEERSFIVENLNNQSCNNQMQRQPLDFDDEPLKYSAFDRFSVLKDSA